MGIGIAASVRSKLDNLDVGRIRNTRPNICRVPADIRSTNASSYDPKLISIGPLHHGRHPETKHMEEVKLLYLHDLLGREGERATTAVDSSSNQLNRYADAILRLEDEARREYSVDQGVENGTSEEFVEMLLVDGCFVVEFLLKRAEGKVGKPLNTGHLWYMPCLRRDLLLLENQIPLFILETILEHSSFTSHALLDLALHYLCKGRIGKEMLVPYKVYHLLHLSYLCLMLQRTTPPAGRSICKKPRMLPSATELREAGVVFGKKDVGGCYLDVCFDFDTGKMEIPMVHVQGSSSSEFRNFLALEQCCPDVGNSFTSYVVFMANLIKTEQDVALLRRLGIVETKLGSDADLAMFFNGLQSGLCFDFDSHYLVGMFVDVLNYYNNNTTTPPNY